MFDILINYLSIYLSICAQRFRTLPLKLEWILSLLVAHVKVSPLFLVLVSACLALHHVKRGLDVKKHS